MSSETGPSLGYPSAGQSLAQLPRFVGANQPSILSRERFVESVFLSIANHDEQGVVGLLTVALSPDGYLYSAQPSRFLRREQGEVGEEAAEGNASN